MDSTCSKTLNDNSLKEKESLNNKEIVEYFDKRDDEEDSIIDFCLDTSRRYEKLEKLYNEIVPLDYYEAAKKKTLSEQVRLKIKTDRNKTFNYGEMTFRTMAYVFEVIKQNYGNDSIKSGEFYDLGSVKYK
jgi:hypothetical protein